MRPHCQQEDDEEMVRVPERLIRLLSDLVMRSGVHHEHAVEHDVTGYAACLGVLDLNCSFGSDLISFNIEEAGLVQQSYVNESRSTHLT